MKKFVSVFVHLLICAALLFLLYWFLLPPLNPRSIDFWFYVICAIIILLVFNAFASVKRFFTEHEVILDGKNKKGKRKTSPAFSIKLAFGSIGIIIIAGAVVTLAGNQFFHASSYNQLLTLEDGNFADDVAELTMDQIPVVDHDTAIRLGNRKLGEMSDLVSQFEIDQTYTQINYQKHPIRVTPLLYGDLIKWFNNQQNGIPAYLMVDMTSQETTLVQLEEGIKYSESEYLLRNIHRYLRFQYPTKIFHRVSFEIDDNGTPFWIASTVSYRIGWWSGKDLDGAVLVNAITGESQYYPLNEVPTWVDQVFDAGLIMEQLGYNGRYRSGFWNSIIGQKGVLQPTDGYNYIAIGDDVYLYTGMTSVTSDESNVGFVLVNLRTKESRYYSVPGAEEYSAMASAEGQVQNLKYHATFPILLNVSDRPTYFMSLKDDAGLVKMYAFVDVEQYQIVGTGSTLDAAREDYATKLKSEQDIEITDQQEHSVEGTIAAISSAVVEGNTKYYLQLDGDDAIYELDISISNQLPFAKVGDHIQLNGHLVMDELIVSDIVWTPLDESKKE
jgi:hypothetical protein